MSDLTREKVEWCRMQGCTCEEENQDPKCWWCCTCDMALRSLDGVVPSINVKVEIPMPPYAGGAWYAEVVRVEQEDDGSYTAVIDSTRAAASEQNDPLNGRSKTTVRYLTINGGSDDDQKPARTRAEGN